METVLLIVEVIALICLSALCVYLVIVLMGLRRDLAEFSQRSRPLIANLTYITEKLKSAAQKIDDHVDIVKSSLNSLKSVADNVLNLEQRVQEHLEEPIVQVASVIGSIVSALGYLFERFRSRS